MAAARPGCQLPKMFAALCTFLLAQSVQSEGAAHLHSVEAAEEQAFKWTEGSLDWLPPEDGEEMAVLPGEEDGAEAIPEAHARPEGSSGTAAAQPRPPGAAPIAPPIASSTFDEHRNQNSTEHSYSHNSTEIPAVTASANIIPSNTSGESSTVTPTEYPPVTAESLPSSGTAFSQHDTPKRPPTTADYPVNQWDQYTSTSKSSSENRTESTTEYPDSTMTTEPTTPHPYYTRRYYHHHSRNTTENSPNSRGYSRKATSTAYPEWKNTNTAPTTSNPFYSRHYHRHQYSLSTEQSTNYWDNYNYERSTEYPDNTDSSTAPTTSNPFYSRRYHRHQYSPSTEQSTNYWDNYNYERSTEYPDNTDSSTAPTTSNPSYDTYYNQQYPSFSEHSSTVSPQFRPSSASSEVPPFNATRPSTALLGSVPRDGFALLEDYLASVNISVHEDEESSNDTWASDLEGTFRERTALRSLAQSSDAELQRSAAVGLLRQMDRGARCWLLGRLRVHATGAEEHAFARRALGLAALLGDGACLSRLMRLFGGRLSHAERTNEFFASVESGRADSVAAWIQAGVDVDAKNQSGMVALSAAAYEGHVHVLRQLLAAGADVEGHAAAQWTPLIWAARAGHAGAVRALLSAGAVLEGGSCSRRVTALGASAVFSHRHVMHILQSCGAQSFWNDEPCDARQKRCRDVAEE